MEVIDKIRRAYCYVIANDAHLLTANAHEQSITHRFAVYIEREFPEFHIDCEYNRNGLDKKKLETLEEEGKLVKPDIVVHHRNTNNNLIVIEAKLTECDREIACRSDMNKLRAFKEELKYTHAFYVVFPVEGALKNFEYAKLIEYIVEI